MYDRHKLGIGIKCGDGRQVDYASIIKMLIGSNARSVGHFDSGHHLAVARLFAASDLT